MTDVSRDVVPPSSSGVRLDVYLAEKNPDCSRSYWKKRIESGQVQANGSAIKPKYEVQPGDVLTWTEPDVQILDAQPEDIPLDILFEDEWLVVVNKAPGIVVHPAAGHADGTLVNALLHHCGDLGTINGTIRPGIVHRLDQDTSGILIVAKNDDAMKGLMTQFKDRSIFKEYQALVRGIPEPSHARIETLIGRHPHNRKTMSTKVKHGKNAISVYRVEEKLDAFSLVRVEIKTGRTHQIRVHMTHIGHPVLGDKVYGNTPCQIGFTPIDRQMLHACRTRFTHPHTGSEMEITAPIPQDMQLVLEAARQQMRHVDIHAKRLF
ncbi:MAG: RluA family pseudouridine synthase [Spartobacteria bacterium]|nr:RluA family pseudouridine synthase [Spartobacteria bacterium]